MSARRQLTEGERAAIRTIVGRVVEHLDGRDGYNWSLRSPYMKRALRIVHLEVKPLDLDGLAAAHLFDLTHDVLGIVRHLDYGRGTLRDCFVPRYALLEQQGGAS